MRYLVTGQYVEPGPLLPPDKVVFMVQEAVLPSLELLARMEAEGKILAGGVHSGGRIGTMIVEAASNEELDGLLGKLPFWGLLRWTVVPLTGFADRAKWESQAVADMKKRMAG
jgi:hypothetical protein